MYSVEAFMENISYMMHLSVCLCFVGMFFFCSFNLIEFSHKSLIKSFIHVLLTKDIVHSVHSRIGYVIPEACLYHAISM